MFKLNGKVALVTGATSGIGLSFVKELLNNYVKGITLVDIDANKSRGVINKLEKEFGEKRVMFVEADVGNKKQMIEAFEETVKCFKQVDIVINNAGIVQELEWENCVATNLTGVINGSLLALESYLPKYKNGDEGVIVNISSLAGLVPSPEGPVYCATKAGVITLTRSIGNSIRYKNHKVRVLAICPGFTSTGFFTVSEKQISELYRSILVERIRKSPIQTVEALATNLIMLIKSAPNGSVWSILDGKCFENKF